MEIYYDVVDFKGLGKHQISVLHEGDKVKNYWVKVHYIRWCNEHASVKPLIRDQGEVVQIFFMHKHDAMQFKLVFG